jgi:hypothetical protein
MTQYSATPEIQSRIPGALDARWTPSSGGCTADPLAGMTAV